MKTCLELSIFIFWTVSGLQEVSAYINSQSEPKILRLVLKFFKRSYTFELNNILDLKDILIGFPLTIVDVSGKYAGKL